MKLKILLILILTTVLFACTSNQKPKQETTPAEPVEIVFQVEGMTCDHCEMSVHKGVTALEGISEVQANHEDSTTLVVFDPSKTDKKQIAEAIEKRGFKVVK